MSKNNPRFKSALGITSLVLFLVMIITFIPVKLDVAHKASLPENQGEGGWGPALEFLFWQLLVWAPLLTASFITGLVAIVNDKGRIAGAIAVSAVGIFVLGAVIMNNLWR